MTDRPGMLSKKAQSEEAWLHLLLHRLGILQGYFVEFGAWDGVRLSQTRTLREQGWRGTLIEADAQKFAALERNVPDPAITKLHARVETTGDSTLDNLLDRAAAPATLDLLSIDIDSDDLAVWLSLTRYRARVVLIEFNITIPFDTDFVNPRGRNWGNSALTVWKMAQGRGYACVGIQGMNLVFVDRPLLAQTGMEEVAFHTPAATGLPRYFWGYDGTLLSTTDGASPAELLSVPFHQFRFVQPMPRWLRHWHLGHERARRERIVGALSRWLLRPLSSARRLLRHHR